MTTEPKSTFSTVRAFLFRPNPRQPMPVPNWFAPLAVIGLSLVVVAEIFALVAGSRVLAPATGHIYRISVGRGHRYVAFWQFVIFDALTIPAMCMFGIFALILFYNLVVKYRAWRRP